MNLLFDTNVISSLRRPELNGASFLAWSHEVDRELAGASVISLMELEKGIRLSERRGRPEAPMLRLWFEEQARPSLGSRVLSVTEPVALRAASFITDHGTELADALIAATASVHGLTLVTRNTRDFEPLGIPLLNPWDPTPT